MKNCLFFRKIFSIILNFFFISLAKNLSLRGACDEAIQKPYACSFSFFLNAKSKENEPKERKTVRIASRLSGVPPSFPDI